MKTCVSSYSFGHYNSDLSLPGVIRKAAEMGFQEIEFTDGGWLDDPTLIDEMRETAAEVGLPIANVCVGADFLNGSGGDLKDEIRRLQKRVDAVARLGARSMRHDVGWGVSGRSYAIGYDDVLPILATGCREVTRYAAEKHGIVTMTENHGQFSQDSVRVEKLINAVADPNFGTLIDIGNFLCVDEDPTEAVGRMTPYAKHVHVKDFHIRSGMEVAPGEGWFTSRAGNYLRGAIVGHGNAKVYQSLRVLHDRGYHGTVSIEFEGLEDNLRGLSIGLNNLKRFLSMIGE